MWKIKEDLLLDMTFSAKQNLPKEFLCFLGGDKQKEVITEIIFFPTTTGETVSSINTQIIPITSTIIGSIHSHPNGSIMPSQADKNFFKKFEINIIIGLSKEKTKLGFYNKNAERINIDIKKRQN